MESSEQTSPIVCLQNLHVLQSLIIFDRTIPNTNLRRSMEMTRLRLYLILCVVSFLTQCDSFSLKRLSAVSIISLTTLLPIMGIVPVARAEEMMKFGDFVSFLGAGNVQAVTFKGVNPTGLIATDKNGKQIRVEEGFPAFNDPASASGPQQAIALCQHTPGVVVTQDLSDILGQSKTGKLKDYKVIPMMQSSKYPSSF